MLRSLMCAALGVATLITPCLGDAFTDAAKQIPQCGLDCILNNLNAGSSPCGTAFNETCICNQAMDADGPLQNCIFANCTGLEQLQVAQLSAQACSRPVRSRKGKLYAALAVELPAFLCLLLRFFSRWYTVQHFETDDWIMIFVGVCYVVFEVVGQLVIGVAFGVDIWTVSPAAITQALLLFYIDETFYLAIVCLTKISILYFYLRIFPTRGFRIAAYIVMGWVAISHLIFLFMQIFQCTPVNSIWEGWTGEFGPHRCIDVNRLSYIAAGFSIAQDAVLIVLPFPLLLNLNATWRTKAGIILMFSLGIFVMITSCIRLRYLVLFARSKNPTWDYDDTLVWTGAEVAVSIIVTSLPAIRVLINRVWPNLFGSLHSRRGTSSNRHYGDSMRRGEESAKMSGSGGMHSSSSRSNGAMGRSAQSRIFSMMAGPGQGSDEDVVLHDTQLELGDKKNGAVLTEIGAGSSGHEESSEDGSIKGENEFPMKRQRSVAGMARPVIVRANSRGRNERALYRTNSSVQISRAGSTTPLPTPNSGIQVTTTMTRKTAPHDGIVDARPSDDFGGPK